jgi:hypothetical protein
MKFPIIADSSPEIETWKMIVTIACALLTAGVTVWNLFLSRMMKLREQHYGAQIDKALQDHKAELDKEARKHESDLKQFSFVAQTRFAAFHAKQIETMGEVYTRLFLMTEAFPKVDRSTEIMEEGLADLLKKRDELFTYFLPREAYLPDDVAELLHTLRGSIDSFSDLFNAYITDRAIKVKLADSLETVIAFLKDKVAIEDIAKRVLEAHKRIVKGAE